jgi:hypothetical protein
LGQPVAIHKLDLQESGKAKRVVGKKSRGSTVSVSSRVMSMDQILDRFIDDSKLIKCEEAQRLALHTNGMAYQLKVEAKQRCQIPEVIQCCYQVQLATWNLLRLVKKMRSRLWW